MKLFIKLLLFIVLLALAAPFFMKKPDGSPMLTLQSLGLGTVAHKVSEVLPDSRPELPKTAEVYRWQDEKGIWHYSDKAQTPAAQKHQLQISQNRLPHVAVADKEEDEGADESLAHPQIPEHASLGDVPQLLKQVEQIKKTAEQRNKTLEAQ